MRKKGSGLTARSVSGSSLLDGISVDEAWVYLVGNEHGDEPRLQAVPIAGGEPRFLAGEDDPHLYLARPDNGTVVVAAQQQLFRVAATGGPLEPLAALPAGFLSALAAEGTSLYGALPAARDGGVFRVSRDGGEVKWLARGVATGLATAPGRVACAVDGCVRVLDEAGREIAATRAVLEGTPETPAHLCFAGAELVFTTTRGLVAWNPTTDARRTLVDGRPLQLARLGDDAVVYTVATSRKTEPWLLRLRIDGTSPAEGLVQGRSKGGAIAVGPTALAWIDDWDGGAFVADYTASTPG
jgi:hypothetical protein